MLLVLGLLPRVDDFVAILHLIRDVFPALLFVVAGLAIRWVGSRWARITENGSVDLASLLQALGSLGRALLLMKAMAVLYLIVALLTAGT